GELVHDLVFENGVVGTRLSPGASERIDVGVITQDLAGWCSIIGHRQMGMTLDIVAVGAAASEQDQSAQEHDHGSSGSSPGDSAAPLIDATREPSEGFTPFDARLMPLDAYDTPRRHEVTLEVTDEIAEVAPGGRQRLWKFGGSAPGP